jgi:hypothetical protein
MGPIDARRRLRRPLGHVTTPPVSGRSANIASSASAGDVARDWEAVRRSTEIQFAPLPPVKPPETPAWLEAFQRFLEAVFGPLAKWLIRGWPVIEKLLIVTAVLLVLYLLWRLLGPFLMRLRNRKAEPGNWAPSREDALALLDDADRLAAEGRYGEAAHLLLRRSVGQIRAARPNVLIPASTAREIALLPQLPQSARSAFGIIAERVERSLFGLRDLDAGDWRAARAAYADFALAELRA